MNPVYTGKDVSYIDTKQAQRAIETAAEEAERLATLAWLDGAPFPHAALDKVWRLLAYGAHHDGITGVEGDQVYLDLLGGWREAWELADAARRDAVARLAAPGPGAVSVVNGLGRPRDGLARVTVAVPEDGTRWLEVRDDSGAAVPSLAEGIRRRGDGSLAEVTLTFAARDVPGLGARPYQLAVAEPDTAPAWREVAGNTIENGAYLVTADPERGGTVGVTDKRTGARVLTGPGNELVLQDEYDKHPRHGEGPWHLAPKGPGAGSASVPATVRSQRCAIGARLVATFTLDGLTVTQETLLWDGEDRVEFRTHVDGYASRDRLLRVRFPADVPGGLPVYQTATAVIGRSFGVVDVDSAEVWYTLDNPAHQWFGLGSTARVRTGGRHGSTQAIGVAEVVCPDDRSGLADLVRELLVALAGAGVTATCSQADGPRYGGLDADSNLPDVRIAVGGPEVNQFTAEALSAAGPGYAKALAARQASAGTARLWVPGGRNRADAFGPDADVRGAGDLPVLMLAGTGPAELTAAVRALIADLADAVVDAGDVADGEAPAPGPELADRSVAVFNRGTPSAVVTADGTLYMSLMRSCSAWPASIWIDGDPRTAPDGSSFAWQHWSHTFEYALACGPGDWRTADFNRAAEDYGHDLLAITAAGVTAGGPVPAAGAGLSVEPENVTLSALKPRGNPLAAGRVPARPARGGAEVTVRLRETSGRATAARIRLDSVSAAWLTDLLEESDGAALPVDDGTVVVDMSPFSTVTVVLRTAAPAGRDGTAAPGAEPVQPVYARYWLHGKGPAPAGNLPTAVHFSPTRTALPDPAQGGTLTLTVGCGATSAAGTVELVTPAEVSVTPAQDLRYELAPGGYASWDLTVRVAPETPAGRYFVAARIRDETGQLIEDTAMVAVGEERWPDLDLPPEVSLERMQADYMAGAAEVDLQVLTPELRLPPGGRGELLVRVSSGLGSELHGEALLASPFGSWESLGAWTQGFSVAPGQSTELRFAVSVPETARPGARWWALAKVMYYGRVRYSEAISVAVEAAG